MAKNIERLQAREAKELIRREKQLGARSNKFYLIYLFMILSRKRSIGGTLVDLPIFLDN